MTPSSNRQVLYDNIHDAIALTRVESRVLKSAYYQRLKWIRQLGFSFYVFSGATHTRFAHGLGVLHIMDKILHSIGKAVPEVDLFDHHKNDEATLFHRTMRLSALLHDIGTFPFSHTIELAYINHWRQQRAHGVKVQMANHETLGQSIILDTDFEGGITRILKEEGIDPAYLAAIIAGKSKDLLANQLLHSDVDADRMDYLLRDAHHTGIQLGLYDKDYLINKLTIGKIGNQEVLCVQEEAVNTVEYFLLCRYSWYSQIINDGTGYKFDLIAAKIYEYFLENGMAHTFEHLVKKVIFNPNEYFTFNDSYFMAKLHEYLAGRMTHPMIRELSEMLMGRHAPKQIKISPVEPTLVQSEDHRQELIREVTKVANWIKDELRRLDPSAWMIFDIPSNDVMFTKNWETIRKSNSADPRLNRDAVKILDRHGEIKLLIEVSNSLMKILSQYRNFIPRIYVSTPTYELLERNGILKAIREKRYK